MSNQKQEVLNALSKVIDPDLNRDIVSLGFIKDLKIEEGKVDFVLELTTPACPLKASFQKQCEDALNALSWVKDVNLTMSSRQQRAAADPKGKKGLAKVSHVIGVSSCKGGVGKSTIAVNLAFTLSRMGAKVGLLDADIYGPSLPTLIKIENTSLMVIDGLIQPIEYQGVKLMSFGYAQSEAKAAIMRGPMVSGVISQLATETDWGELDYLVVDMPPGTGDIQLTLTQQLPFVGALIVTTPQKLSFVDVVKGIQMFEAVQVPTLGVIENMSYFVCDNCDKRHTPFGEGALARLTEQYGLENTFKLPLLPEISAFCDEGRPAVLIQPDSELTKSYSEIAEITVREVSKIENGGIKPPKVEYQKDKGIVVTEANQIARFIDPADLRRRCTCAACKDEHTGEAILKPEQVPDDVFPTSINKMGNYAVAITWSDGHDSSIYPYNTL